MQASHRIQPRRQCNPGCCWLTRLFCEPTRLHDTSVVIPLDLFDLWHHCQAVLISIHMILKSKQPGTCRSAACTFFILFDGFKHLELLLKRRKSERNVKSWKSRNSRKSRKSFFFFTGFCGVGVAFVALACYRRAHRTEVRKM